MRYLYLIIDVASFLVPFIFSFHPKLQFYKRWKFVWPSIFIIASFFIAWDIYFTYLGVWGFNPSYLTGLYFGNLPIEEVLFFIMIPYPCLFTYHCFKILIDSDYFLKTSKSISLFLVILLLVLAAVYISKLYTSVTFVLLAALLLVLKFVVRPGWLSRFYFTYLILLIPFTIVNGILTGTGLKEPVVWYNNLENLGIRLLTIPVEDIFYGMLLILLNVSFYEYFSRKNAS